jgi:hypothetical protein
MGVGCPLEKRVHGRSSAFICVYLRIKKGLQTVSKEIPIRRAGFPL